jgi:hypothetical protein
MSDFNPIKQDKDGIIAKRVIWTSKSLEAAIKGLVEGRKLVANPFYENNTKLLKGDLVFKRTDEEIEEFKHCMNDVIYFAEKYCQLMTPEGIKHIKLRDYQIKYLRHLEKNRLSIYRACRQCAKTTTSAIFLLHYALFNTDKNTLVLGNKRKTAVEILDKIKKIYLEIPYFLKPGIYKWNEAEIVFDNGCRVMAEATTINSGISFTFHCVLADEFAHVPPNILDKFYNNLFPTITAGRARFIITSTPLDFNLFYRLFKAAEAGENDYAPFSTDWWEVPEWNPEKRCWEKRDEEWHQRQIANYGSEEAFNKQFGASFDVNANTLVKVKKIKEMREKAVEFVNKDIYGVSHPEFFFWDPNYDPMDDLRKDHIIITCDLAEGGGNDYTVFIFNKLLKDGDTRTIGMFRCNSLGLDITSRILQEICCKWCNSDRLLVSIELNMYGELFSKLLFTNRDIYDDLSNFDENCLVKYYNKEGNKFTYGIKLNSGNKTVGCKLFKEKIEKDIIENLSTVFLMELENFSDNKGNDTYQASFGHDDSVMAQMQIIFVMQTPQYRFLLDDLESGNNQYNEDFYNPYGETYNYYTQNSYYNIEEMYEEERNNNLNRLNRF